MIKNILTAIEYDSNRLDISRCCILDTEMIKRSTDLEKDIICMNCDWSELSYFIDELGLYLIKKDKTFEKINNLNLSLADNLKENYNVIINYK